MSGFALADVPRPNSWLTRSLMNLPGVQEVLSFLRVSTRQRDSEAFFPGARLHSFTTDDIPGFYDMVLPRATVSLYPSRIRPCSK